jgi:hypothetical protein
LGCFSCNSDGGYHGAVVTHTALPLEKRIPFQLPRQFLSLSISQEASPFEFGFLDAFIN